MRDESFQLKQGTHSKTFELMPDVDDGLFGVRVETQSNCMRHSAILRIDR